MAKDHQIAIRVNSRTYDAVQEFADEYDLNQAEAVRRMVEGRLAGEGYIEGPTVTDGGLVEQVTDRLDEIEDHQQNRLDEIERHQQSRLSDIEQEFKTQSESFGRLGYFLSMALVWIGIEMAFNMPTWLVVSSGIALVAGLMWSLYEYRKEVKA